jgi:hypothetical protein
VRPDGLVGFSLLADVAGGVLGGALLVAGIFFVDGPAGVALIFAGLGVGLARPALMEWRTYRERFDEGVGTQLRRLLAPVLLPLLALVLAACGGDTLALNPVAKAAVRTQGAGTMRVSTTGSFEGAGLDGSFTSSGVFNSDTNSSRSRMTFSGGLAAGLTMEAIQDHLVIYMRGAVFETVLPAGKRWVKLDPEKFSSSLGIDFQELTATSPNQALEQLSEASKSVDEIGDERVRGVMTTHYRAVLDPAKLKLPAKLVEMTAPPDDEVLDLSEIGG